MATTTHDKLNELIRSGHATKTGFMLISMENDTDMTVLSFQKY